MHTKFKNIKRGLWKFGLSAVALCTAIAGAFCLGGKALKADAASYVMNAPENLTARGVEANVNSTEDCYFVSNELPSPDATSVTFQFTIDSFEQKGRVRPGFARVR